VKTLLNNLKPFVEVGHLDADNWRRIMEGRLPKN